MVEMKRFIDTYISSIHKTFFSQESNGNFVGIHALMMTIICDFIGKPTHKKLLKPISALMSDLDI